MLPTAYFKSVSKACLVYKTVSCLYLVFIEVLSWWLHFEKHGFQWYKRLCYFTTWVYWAFVLTWLTDTICMIRRFHEEKVNACHDFPTTQEQKGVRVSLALASISYPLSFLVSLVFWVAVVDWDSPDFKSFWWTLLHFTVHMITVGCKPHLIIINSKNT